MNRSCFIGLSSYKDSSFLYSQRSQGRGIHSGTLRHMIIQWFLNLRVGFGEGVLAHKTMTLHINVLCREAVKSGTPCWFPVFLLLIRSLWRASAPEVWAGQSLSLPPPPPHSPVFSAESAAFAREVDYWIMNYRSFFIFQPSSEMCRYFSTYGGSKWKGKEKSLFSSRERKGKKKKKKQPQSYLTAPSHSRRW